MVNKITIAVIAPLIVGGLIYILFRPETLIMFDWFEKAGLLQFIQDLRTSFKGKLILPQWIIYNLPDALWILSFTNLMLLIWQLKLTKNSIFWILLAPTIGVFSELGQATGILAGTFDLNDLYFILAASITPFIYPKLKTKYS